MTDLRDAALARSASYERKPLLVTSAAVLTFILFAVLSSTMLSRAALADDGPAASDSTVGPEHIISCWVTPRTPYKTSSGAYIVGNTSFKCDGVPDACYYYSELQIWDPYEKRWTRADRTESSYCYGLYAGTTFGAAYPCSSPYYSFTWRTKGHLEAFHGTWDSTTKYSSSISLTC